MYRAFFISLSMMKYLIFVFLAVSFLSCKSIKAQDTIKKKPSKPVYRGEDIGIAPGQFKFKASVVSINETPEAICGKSFEKTVQLEILQIYLIGSSTRNVPTIKSAITFASYKPLAGLKKGKIIDAMATEMLCKDATQSYFMLNDYMVVQ